MYFSNVANLTTGDLGSHLQPVIHKPRRMQVQKMTKKTTDIEKLNETGQRKGDRRQEKSGTEAEACKPAVERRKVKRRRQIDPTTCEREYSELEIEFMHAMDEYKRASGRMFPTCSEILEVLMKLGYRKTAEPQTIYDPNEPALATESEEDLDSIEEEEQLA